MATQVTGPIWGPGQRTRTGHRVYRVTFLIDSDLADGFAAALTTPGLPQPGNVYQIGNDLDVWAWCRYEVEGQPTTAESGNSQWKLTFLFSTEPVGRCQLLPIEN